MKKTVILLSFCIAILSLGCRNTTHSQNKTQQITKQSFILHPEIMNVIKELQLDVSSDSLCGLFYRYE